MMPRSFKKKRSKVRPTSFLGSKFKATLETLEDRRVLAAFTPGDVVIYRAGDGTNALINTGSPVFLDEYTPAGTLVQSVAMPTAASGNNVPLITSGTASSEGMLTRSSNAQYLVVPGYDSTIPAASSLSGSTATAVPRVVGLVDGNGVVNTSNYFNDWSDGNNPRSAASVDGTKLWLGGAAGGVREADVPGSPTGKASSSNDLTTLSSPTPLSNVRQVDIFNGQLYATSNKTNIGVSTIGSGLPTSGTQNVTVLNGVDSVATPSPDSYYFADLSPTVSGVDTLYVADDTLGILKFSLNAGHWDAVGKVGVGTDAYRGLTATVVGSSVTLFATRNGGTTGTGGGELVKLLDTTGYGGTLTGTPTVIATAGANKAFRGVALAPVAPSNPPVVTTNGGALAYTENAGAQAVDNTLTVTDDGTNLFSATVTVSSNYVSGEDVLNFTNQNGITGSFDASTGTLTLLGTASVANYQTALRSVTYTNTSENPSTATRTVSVVAYDASQPSNTATRNITVASINDAPVNTVPASQQSVGINGSFAFSTGNGNLISIADVDAGTASEQVTLSVTSGSLTLSTITGLSFSVGDGNADPTMTFTGTVGAINTALSGMTYSAPGATGTVTLTITTNDQGHTGTGGALSDTDTVSILITSTPNSPPVITTTGTALSYTENDPATAVDPGLTVTDSDDANMTSATVTISSNYAPAEDSLTFVDQNGIHGSFSGGVLTLTGTTTKANYQTALRSVKYVNSSDAPSTLTRTVSFVVRDGNDPSAPATRNLSVTSVNDAPVNTVPSGTLNVTKNGSRTFTSAFGNAFSIADLDAGAAAVQFSIAVANGKATLSGTTGLTGSGNGTASMTYTGTLAAINTALDGLLFAPTAGFSGAASIQLTSNDQGNTGTGGAKTDTDTVNLTVVNPAPLLINEIFFNPPGPDSGNQYIEIRSTTGTTTTIPAGTYLVGIDGNTAGNPGDVTDIFDLSNMQTGSNGILLLLEEGGGYDGNLDPNAKVIENAAGAGFGNNAAFPNSSDVKHSADGQNEDLVHASETFMLIQAPVAPALTDDIDTNNDGIGDGGGLFGNWTMLDSVGVTGKNPDPGNYVYGQINFTNTDGAGTASSGTTVPVDFSAGYVARSGNTTGWSSADWVAGDSQTGLTPSWTLSRTTTVPAGFAGLPLNTLGGSNFPGILADPVADLNGPGADGRDNGVVFTVGGAAVSIVDSTATVTDTSSTTLASAKVVISNLSDGAAESLAATTTGTPISASYAGGTLNLTGTATLAQYQQVLRTVTYNDTAANPITTARILNVTLNDGTNTSLTSIATVAIRNPANVALLNEIEVNPPGSTDPPYEYIELRGTPGTTLNSISLVDVDGNFSGTPGTSAAGTALLVIDLSGKTFGANGLMVITSPTGGHSIPAGTTIVTNAALGPGGAGLQNSTSTFELVFGPTAIVQGDDYDANDDGTLELPATSTVLDTVGWSDGGLTDIVYGGVSLVDSAGTPDAATRFSNVLTHSASAWYSGDLVGSTPDDPAQLTYDQTRASANIPSGAVITPGATNFGTGATDQAPVVSTTGAALSYTAGGAAIAVDTGLTVTDVDNTTLAGATVSISAGMQSGDTLSFTNQNGISGSFSAGTLTLTGSATLANYQIALRSITFFSTTSSLATRTVSFTADDGTLPSTAATRTINVFAPAEIAAIYAKGSTWSTNYNNYLGSHSLGNSTTPSLGFALQTGLNQLKPLPWFNVNTIEVVFSQNVSGLSSSSLLLTGTSGTPPTPTLASYNSTTFTATWTLSAALGDNKWRMGLSSSGITDDRGGQLDGEFTNTVGSTAGSSFPTGNGTSGGNLDLRFNLLPGDADRNSVVNALDVSKMRGILGKQTTDATYSPFFDVDGNAVINALDVSKTRGVLGTQLPTNEPPNLSFGAPLSLAMESPLPGYTPASQPSQATTSSSVGTTGTSSRLLPFTATTLSPKAGKQAAIENAILDFDLHDLWA